MKFAFPKAISVVEHTKQKAIKTALEKQEKCKNLKK